MGWVWPGGKQREGVQGGAGLGWDGLMWRWRRTGSVALEPSDQRLPFHMAIGPSFLTSDLSVGSPPWGSTNTHTHTHTHT